VRKRNGLGPISTGRAATLLLSQAHRLRLLFVSPQYRPARPAGHARRRLRVLHHAITGLSRIRIFPWSGPFRFLPRGLTTRLIIFTNSSRKTPGGLHLSPSPPYAPLSPPLSTLFFLHNSERRPSPFIYPCISPILTTLASCRLLSTSSKALQFGAS
jgi:hypothetical protein